MSHPSMVRTRCNFLGFHDPSGATGPLFGSDDVAGAVYQWDGWGTPFQVHAFHLYVVETQSAHTETVTVTWRPTPGSATGAVTLGTFVVPASVAAGARLTYSLNRNAESTATIGAAAPTGVYGIGGSFRYPGDALPVCGPGGEFLFSDSGSSTAGQYNIWIEYEPLSLANANGTASDTNSGVTVTTLAAG
jgi:hypothetical protein